MTQGLYLVLAACVGGPPSGESNWTDGAVLPAGQNVTYYEAPRGVLNRLQNLFGRRPQPMAYYPAQPVVAPTAVSSAEPPMMFQGPVQHVTNYQGQAPAPDLGKLRVARQYEKKVGHETDYRWITGHLFFVHADGGRWVVRYTTPDEVDKYGGSVVLAPGVEMKNFREGDLVCVSGEVLNEGRTSRSLGGALYRVNTISMVDRAD